MNHHESFSNCTPQKIGSAFSNFIDSIKINSVRKSMCAGRLVVIKRRRRIARLVANIANGFFSLSRAPLRVWTTQKDWVRWGVLCYNKLHGPDYSATMLDDDSLREDCVPGVDLVTHAKNGTLTPEMFDAAGREFSRAHRIWIHELDDEWSHGDAHMGNVLYDERAGRARLIDFEVEHKRALSAIERHADDLHVFLCDMIGRVNQAQWITFSTRFLRAYGDEKVIAELRNRLATPRGIPWVWWRIRTSFCPSKVAEHRFKQLAHNIDTMFSGLAAVAQPATAAASALQKTAAPAIQSPALSRAG